MWNFDQFLFPLLLREDVNYSTDRTQHQTAEETYYDEPDAKNYKWINARYNLYPATAGKKDDSNEHYNQTHDGGNYASDGSKKSSVRNQATWQSHQPATEAAAKQDSDDGSSRVVILSGDTTNH